MKGFSMNKVLSTIRRKPTHGSDAGSDPQGDSPEAIAARSVRAFCESGGPNNGDEVTLLPPIVDAAESSPAAAAECARIIRKFLHRDYWTKPTYQYNAIMLMRILADNPGMTFTRNLDKKFLEVIKELLRGGRDPSVSQMLMETLDSFEQTKQLDEGLIPVIELWRKEKEKARRVYGSRPGAPARGTAPGTAPGAFDGQSQNYFARSHNSRRLPEPVELASRLEEARTSAKLLQQVVQCTPPSEVLDNELIKEFADRCLSASRSVQNYMTARDPAPDNDTMESLIDTNEQLQQSLSLHQRSMLNARKHLGIGEASSQYSASSSASRNGGAVPPEVNGATRPPAGKGKAAEVLLPLAPPPPPRPPVMSSAGSSSAGPSSSRGNGSSSSSGNGYGGSSSNGNGASPMAGEHMDNPFRDPYPSRPGDGGGGSSGSLYQNGASSSAGAKGTSSSGPAPTAAEPRLAFEPYHPGFGATPSYLGRQDSAINKVQMHGAATGAPQLPPISTSTATAASGATTTMPQKLSAASESNYSNEDDGADAYDASPKRTTPMYRY